MDMAPGGGFSESWEPQLFFEPPRPSSSLDRNQRVTGFLALRLQACPIPF